MQCLSRLRSRSAPQLCFTLFKDEFIEISTKLSAVVACRCSPTQRGRRHDGSGDLVATRLPRFSLFPLTRSPSSTALLGIVATKDVYISTLSDTWNPSFPPLSRLSAPTRFPFFFFLCLSQLIALCLTRVRRNAKQSQRAVVPTVFLTPSSADPPPL